MIRHKVAHKKQAQSEETSENHVWAVEKSAKCLISMGKFVVGLIAVFTLSDTPFLLRKTNVKRILTACEIECQGLKTSL
jgi:hypothetical protein